MKSRLMSAVACRNSMLPRFTSNSGVAGCATGLVLCVAHTAGGALVNGGFEADPGTPTYVSVPGGSTLINGWTTTDMGVEWFVPSDYFGLTDSPDGGWVVDLASNDYFAGGIEQTFATVPSTVYQIEFWYGSFQYDGRDGTAEIVVSAGSASQTFSIANSTGDIVWESRSFTFTASSASTTLSFRNTQDAMLHYAFIDGVTVVPTPGSLAVFSLLGLTLRRRGRHG